MVIKKRVWHPVEVPEAYAHKFGSRKAKVFSKMLKHFAKEFNVAPKDINPDLTVTRTIDFSSKHGMRLTEICEPMDPRLPHEKMVATLKHDESIEHEFESEEDHVHDTFDSQEELEKELRDIESEVIRQKREPGFTGLDKDTVTRQTLLSELHAGIDVIKTVAKDTGLMKKRRG